MPTEQKPHARNKNPTLQNHCARERSPLHTDRDGFDHRTTLIKGIQRNIDYCGPRMLTRSYLLALQHNNYQTPDCTIVLQTHIPLVWATHKGNIQQGPPFHESLWMCPSQRTGHYMEYVNSIPPPNGWINRAQEPMARTIPPVGSSK